MTGVPMPRLDNRLEEYTFSWYQGPTTTILRSSCESRAFHQLCPRSMFTYRPPKYWSPPPGRTWLRTVESDLHPLNSAFSQPGDKLKIVMCGGILWKQLRFSKELAPDDDDVCNACSGPQAWITLWIQNNHSQCTRWLLTRGDVLGQVSHLEIYWRLLSRRQMSDLLQSPYITQ